MFASSFVLASCSSSSPVSDFGTGSTKDGGSSADSSGEGFGDGAGPTNGFGGDDSSAPPTCVPSPGNYDIPGNNCDDDGDGKIDNVAPCDTGLTATGDAAAFVKAIGLCQTASGPTDTKWGVVSATFVNGHTGTQPPADAQHGILPKFGAAVTPREGASLGVLSTGTAAEFDDPNQDDVSLSNDSPAKNIFKGPKIGMQTGKSGNPPSGYPKNAQGCGQGGGKVAVNDLAAIRIEIKVPANANGIGFDFDFWSGEWPEYVCSNFNDAFIAYLSSKGFNNGTPDNISFDANKNPVSVNNGFFDRCTPSTQTGCLGGSNTSTATCPGGVSELGGTGFDVESPAQAYCNAGTSTSGGATGWLTTQAPVQPGEVITLELMIWDAGDASWDSSVLVDNFVWKPAPVTTGTGRPPK